MNLHNPLADLPAANSLPVPAEPAAPGTAAQRAFREAVARVEGLRQRLHELRQEQAEARRRYWQQVGPAAQAVVQARWALVGPLEDALLLGCFSRLEERQLTELLLGNAHALQQRFGEDASDILRKYAPRRRTAAEVEAADTPDAPGTPAAAPLLPHEQAEAHARSRRKTKAQREQQAAEQAARQEQELLLTGTKTLYRQLARLHHPDLTRDEAARQQKTALMQRITEAYETDDLYTLLQLLAESGSATPDADDAVLTRYTQALARQQTELKQQLQELKFGDTGFFGSTGKKREQEIRQLKRHLRAEADYLDHVRRLLQEPAELRQLLRELSAAGVETV